jgi:hypothetical protein
MKMHVAELWRYPVKSLAGEPLDSAEISADDIPGDRVVQVYDAEGGIVTARTAPRLLGLKGTLGPMGEPLVNGRPWTAPEVAAAIEVAAGLEPGWPAMRGPTASTCSPCWWRPMGPSARWGSIHAASVRTSLSPGWAGWRSASGLGVEPELAKRSSASKSSGADAL